MATKCNYYVDGKEVDFETYKDAIVNMRDRYMIRDTPSWFDYFPNVDKEVESAPVEKEEENCDMCAIVESLSNQLKEVCNENERLKTDLEKMDSTTILKDIVKMYTNLHMAVATISEKLDLLINNTVSKCKGKKNS